MCGGLGWAQWDREGERLTHRIGTFLLNLKGQAPLHYPPAAVRWRRQAREPLTWSGSMSPGAESSIYGSNGPVERGNVSDLVDTYCVHYTPGL